MAAQSFVFLGTLLHETPWSKCFKITKPSPITSFLVLLFSQACIHVQVAVGENKGVCTTSKNKLNVHKSGYIASPAYYKYGHSGTRSCTWLISTSEGKRIKLEFLRFELRWSRDCRQDYIQVFNGDKVFDSPTLTEPERVCGSESPSPLFSDGPHMVVYFRSINSGPFEEGEFRLKFSTVEHQIFNAGAMIAIIMGVILVVLNIGIFYYYCRRKKQRRQLEQRRRARREALQHRTQQTPSANGDEAEDTGVTGSNLNEPPSYESVLDNTVQTYVPMDNFYTPHPPPVYPGTDEPETPPPPYPGVGEQPPQFPAPTSHHSPQRI